MYNNKKLARGSEYSTDTILKKQDSINITTTQAAFLGDVAHDAFQAGRKAERRRILDLLKANPRTIALYQRVRDLFGEAV